MTKTHKANRLAKSDRKRKKKQAMKRRGSAKPLEGKCGAQLVGSRPPRYCIQDKLYPNGRCHKHGGPSLKGVESATFKHGKYSKYCNTKFRDVLDQFLDADDYLEQRAEIELLDARIAELLGRVGNGETEAAWKQVLKDIAEFKKLWEDGTKIDDLKVAAKSLFLTAEAVRTDYSDWRALQSTIEQRRRLIESERKRQIETGFMLTQDAVARFYDACLRAVTDNVSDRKVLSAIQAQLSSLYSPGSN